MTWEIEDYYCRAEFPDEFCAAMDEIIARLSKRTTQIECGRNRTVFIFKKYVIKLPRNLDGLIDNDWEGSAENDIYARAKLVIWKDIPIVLMEKAPFANKKEIINKLGYYPDWVMSIDCGQVGFNSKGKLVAFDYGRR